MVDRVLYCSHCKKIYFSSAVQPDLCLKCRRFVYDTGIPKDDWINFTSEEKSKLKNEWFTDEPFESDVSDADETNAAEQVSSINEQSNFDGVSLSDTQRMNVLLSQIAQSTKKTAMWVNFWSILSLIGIGIYIIAILSNL